jgi:NAD(P) transhydrogenase subunit alpha
MIVGIVSETLPGERRVALTPTAVAPLAKAGMQVVVQRGAGAQAGFADAEYQGKGCRIGESREAVLGEAEIICMVRVHDGGVSGLRSGQTVVGLADPLGNAALGKRLAEMGVRCFALELLPRITRAQAMDVLSSQATVAGYKAVLLAATHLPRMMPMMMTAAGTIPAAKAFVIGAGVAGLQAIASCRRLGAVVTAYDVRPVVKEQIESLGAKFLQIELSGALAEGQGGYAKAMDEDFYRRQRELMAGAVKQADVVITTAAIPGKPPPLLITAEAVRAMRSGSAIVDLAARIGQSGGNCELTQPDGVLVTENGVTILGPTNLPAAVPQTASQLYARNVATFLLNIVKDGALKIDMNDEITRDTLLCENGVIVHQRVKDAVEPSVIRAA